jgi:hypothetical protein
MNRTLSLIVAIALTGCYPVNNQPEGTDDLADNGPVITIGTNGDTEGTEGTEPPVNPDSDGDGVNDVDDCKPFDPAIYPGAVDDKCDGVDYNCDDSDLTADSSARSASECGGEDLDGDEYFDVGFDEAGNEYVVDCDDTNAAVNPGATEVPYDTLDNDCSALTLDDDLDQDGALNAVDCDDDNPDVGPGEDEILDNDLDDDCDPLTLDDSIPDPLDADGDGSLDADDCDDTDPTIFPGAPVVFYDEVDDDCDGNLEDDQDCDGYGLAVDCDDLDDTVHDTCEIVAEEEPVVEEPVVEACAGGFSIVTGFFQAPAGSTFTSIYGRRVGPNGELVDDWFDDTVSWTDLNNDPTGMIVVYDADTVVFLLDACVGDVGATWTVNGMYTDSFGVNHWICEGSSLTTVDHGVWYDLDEQTVTAWNWGGGCDARWSQ